MLNYLIFSGFKISYTKIKAKVFNMTRKPSQNGKTTLPFTDESKSCPRYKKIIVFYFSFLFCLFVLLTALFQI